MSEARRKIKGALDLLWTGLTGTTEEIKEKAEELGRDAERQIKAHRRRLNQPVGRDVDAEAAAQVVDDLEEPPK